MASPSRKPRLLIVDDYPDTRDMYGLYLKESGYDVIEAATGVEALRLAIDDMPDLIVMDLSLPVMDGWEATRRLKADPRTAHIPVIVLTGNVRSGGSGGVRATCDAFVSKPCVPEDLAHEVACLLDRSPCRPTASIPPPNDDG